MRLQKLVLEMKVVTPQYTFSSVSFKIFNVLESRSTLSLFTYAQVCDLSIMKKMYDEIKRFGFFLERPNYIQTLTYLLFHSCI